MLSLDRRTFLTVCQVAKSRHYGLWLNLRRDLRFTSLAGLSSDPYELTFDTSAGPKVATVEEAIAEDPWLEQAVQPASAPARTPDKPEPASPQ